MFTAKLQNQSRGLRKCRSNYPDLLKKVGGDAELT